MGIFVEFGKGEKECFEPVPIMTDVFYKSILEKFDILDCDGVDLIDIENDEKVNMGDDLLSQEYKLEINKRGMAKNELRKRGIVNKDDWIGILNSELIKLLVDSGESMISIFLNHAIFTRDIDLMNFLFSQEKKVRIDICTLCNIEEYCSPEMLKTVLSYEDTVEKINVVGWGGRHPLYHSVRGGRIENVRVLLEYGANINLLYSSGETPLYIAIHINNIEIAKELISKGADVNLGKSILIEYINKYSTPDIEFIKFLMKNGLDITRKHKLGPELHNLHTIIMTKCNAQITELLCENLSREDILESLNSPLMIKVENKNVLERCITKKLISQKYSQEYSI